MTLPTQSTLGPAIFFVLSSYMVFPRVRDEILCQSLFDITQKKSKNTEIGRTCETTSLIVLRNSQAYCITKDTNALYVFNT
jgi:hypothetical protein